MIFVSNESGPADARRPQAIQRAALMESLDEANGFLRTSDDAHYAACERALQQVTHTLHRLSLVWKVHPVFPPLCPGSELILDHIAAGHDPYGSLHDSRRPRQ